MRRCVSGCAEDLQTCSRPKTSWMSACAGSLSMIAGNRGRPVGWNDTGTPDRGQADGNSSERPRHRLESKSARIVGRLQAYPTSAGGLAPCTRMHSCVQRSHSPETLHAGVDSEALVGQVGNLRPIGNRPTAARRNAIFEPVMQLCGAANPGCRRLSAGALRPAIPRLELDGKPIRLRIDLWP